MTIVEDDSGEVIWNLTDEVSTALEDEDILHWAGYSTENGVLVFRISASFVEKHEKPADMLHFRIMQIRDRIKESA